MHNCLFVAMTMQVLLGYICLQCTVNDLRYLQSSVTGRQNVTIS